MIKISELYIYPVKSLGGIKLKYSKLSQFGLKHDRRWMVVDSKGKFISQREVAKMAAIKTEFNNNKLVLMYNNDKIVVPKADSLNKQIEVTVWDDTFYASKISKNVDNWLSVQLEQDCQLVYMHEQVGRQIDLSFAPLKQYVSFADAFPILVISEESMNDLNNRLNKPVNINRFRANIIAEGCDAFAEDNWGNLTINSIEYLALKKCSRCIMPSINQQTGEKDQVKMLATLNGYRKFDKKIKFGMNLRFKNLKNLDGQSISCGDEIKLIN